VEAQLLLVHSPLVGHRTWEPIANDLAGAGYAVAVPDLASTLTAGTPYHLRQAQVIADSAAGQPAVDAPPTTPAMGHRWRQSASDGPPMAS
jgi:dienelactone hydrolase